METLNLKRRITALEIEMETLKEENERKWKEVMDFLGKFEGGKKAVKKTKED